MCLSQSRDVQSSCCRCVHDSFHNSFSPKRLCHLTTEKRLNVLWKGKTLLLRYCQLSFYSQSKPVVSHNQCQSQLLLEPIQSYYNEISTVISKHISSIVDQMATKNQATLMCTSVLSNDKFCSIATKIVRVLLITK